MKASIKPGAIQLARPEHLTQALRQLAGNLVLFVPFGALLPLMTVRFRSLAPLLLAAAAASASIEVLQLVLGLTGLVGRSVDIDDVILNVLGALVGWAAFRGLYAAWSAVTVGRLGGRASEETARGPA